jgi:hypothetical protein
MIRPLTIATLLMACGSGLYLYQSKHEVQLLDRTIERTVHETSALREQSRLLAAEWTMLNDPERLRQFSDTYLGLKTIAPSQFTSLADLDSRLPLAQAEVPAGDTGEQAPVPVPVPVAVENPPAIVIDPSPAAVAEETLPVPPIPALPPLPMVASVVHPAGTGTPERTVVSRPLVADNQAHPAADRRASEQWSPDQRSPDQRSATRIVEARGETRTAAAPAPRPIVLAAPRPVAVNPPANPRAYALSAPAPMSPAPLSPVPAMGAASAPYNGSLLGMARGSMPPSPRPTPVNAAYNAN